MCDVPSTNFGDGLLSQTNAEQGLFTHPLGYGPQ
jgi:hypothetical protein